MTGDPGGWQPTRRSDAYDLALADPPYRSRMLDRLIDLWLERRFATILTVEHAEDHTLPPGGRQFLFGTTAITTYGLES